MRGRTMWPVVLGFLGGLALLLAVQAWAMHTEEAEGIFQVAVETNVDRPPVYQHFLRLPNGRTILLKNMPPGLVRPGKRIKVRGRRSDHGAQHEFEFGELADGGTSPMLDVAGITNNVGPQKLAVLLVRIGGREPVSKADMQAALAANMGPFYTDESAGKLTLTADVFGPYDIPANVNACNLSAVALAAIQAADPEINWQQYDFATLAGDFSAQNCGYAGIGGLCKWLTTTADGDRLLGISSNFCAAGGAERCVQVMLHEVGHNLCKHHAGTLTGFSGGPTLPPDWPVTGRVCEYCDQGAVMGGSGFKGIDPVMQKVFVGWENVPTITASGRYTFRCHNKPGPQSPGVKIKQGSGDAAYLWVDCKAAVGWDANIATRTSCPQAVTGVSLYLPDTLSGGTWANSKPLLLDTTAAGTTWCGAQLQIGQTYSLPATSTSVTLVNRADDIATVDVSVGNVDVTPPTITWTGPADNASVAIPTAVTWTATVTDDRGLASIGGTLYPDEVVAPPPVVQCNGATTCSYSWTMDTATRPNGTNRLTLKAVDTVSNLTTSAPRSVTLLGGDTTPPTACTVAQTTDATNCVTATVAATDPEGLYRAEYMLNGSWLQFGWRPPDFRFRWCPGPGTYRLKASCQNFGWLKLDSAEITFTVGTVGSTTTTVAPPSTTSSVAPTTSTQPPTTSTVIPTTTTRPPTTSTVAPTTTTRPPSTTTTLPCKKRRERCAANAECCSRKCGPNRRCR